MSYTMIHKVTPGAGYEDLQEFHNSWGSAPVVWGTLTEKVLHKEQFSWAVGSTINAVWALWDDKGLAEFVRAVLGMTFDRIYIERRHFHRAASDIRKFLDWAPQPDSHANHWPAFADLLDSLADDETMPAIGFTHSSVSECLFQGPFNEEKDDYDPPDWSLFWSLYEEIDNPATPQPKETT